jgi:ubiquinone/menaquinone biosynthesis C-methylase UbiE
MGGGSRGGSDGPPVPSELDAMKYRDVWWDNEEDETHGAEIEMDAHHRLIQEKYRRLAPWFDNVAAPFFGAAFQREAVSLLHLKSGDAVVDVACGTGSNFAAIEQGIGQSGRLIGIDLSEEMLQRARARVVLHGWTNVTLINAAIEQVYIDAVADALLFSFAHDVLQSPHALHNLFKYAGPDARVAACGIKLPPMWNMLPAFFIFQIARYYHTMPSGLSKPWMHLIAFISNPEIQLRAFETIYIVHGTARATGSAPHPNTSVS